MSEKETSSLTAITDVATNLPDPVRAGLLSALGKLIGGLKAVPAEWLRRPAQAIADTTAARTYVAAELAKGGRRRR